MTSAWANYKLGFKLLQVEEIWDIDNGFCGRGLSEREKVQECIRASVKSKLLIRRERRLTPHVDVAVVLRTAGRSLSRILTCSAQMEADDRLFSVSQNSKPRNPCVTHANRVTPDDQVDATFSAAICRLPSTTPFA